MMMMMIHGDGADPKFGHTPFKNENIKNQRLGNSFGTSWEVFSTIICLPRITGRSMFPTKKNSGRYKLLHLKLKVYTSKRNSLA